MNKGFQTQTAECLVIGELTCDALLVVLNKIDLLPPTEKQKRIDKVNYYTTLGPFGRILFLQKARLNK